MLAGSHSPPIRVENPSRTTVKPHRSKAVWHAGRGVDDNSRLETLTIIRPCRALSFRPLRLAMTRARSSR